MLLEVFVNLLLICGCLILALIIGAIIVAPFQNAKRKRRKQEFDNMINICLNKIIDDAIKQMEEEKTTKKTTKKKEEK